MIRRVALLVLLLLPAPAWAQAVDLSNRPITDVRVEGLKLVPEQLVWNQVRVTKGSPYEASRVEQDIVRLTHLGRFDSVTAKVEPQQDGSVAIVYVVVEQTLLADVQVVGNKKLTDQELLGYVLLRAGDAIDRFLIDQGKQKIKDAYEDKGYFLAEVEVDEELLKESSILIFRIREGPQPRIRALTFEGNTVFQADELKSQLRSKTYFLIFSKGELSREQLDEDAARVREYYRERGYLDAQVGRRIDLSPNQKDAVVVFFIEEGRQYTVSQISVAGNGLFPRDQILAAMTLKAGDVFSMDRMRKSQEALADMYGKLGLLRARVTVERIFHESEPRVDVSVSIEEGLAYTAGKVTVRGNQTTQERVVLRQLRGVEPGRRFDAPSLRKSEQRLNESALFSEAKIEVLGQDDQEVRDVLVEVKEKNTGSLSFGAGVSSDSGLIGAVDVAQRNFDLTDFPESAGEFFTGKAFRGAGQFFGLTIQPGNEFSSYSTTWREPYLFESRYFFESTLFYFDREREDWDERRFGGRLGIGQRFGDVWSGSFVSTFENIDVADIDPDAAVDVFEVAGQSVLTTFGPRLVRSTTDSRIFPTQGSVFEVGLTRAGVFGGDYQFTRARAEFSKFWTLDEDFLGRRTVLRLRSEIGYIFEDDEAPLFERFYAGGHRSFRGFEFRGVGPRGIRNDTMTLGDDPVGGNFLFLLGFEYNMPVWQDIVRWVFFVDSGTVDPDFSFDEYRVAVGAGLRLNIPFLGQAPFALDFAFPILSQDGDEEQVFSFDIALPF